MTEEVTCGSVIFLGTTAKSYPSRGWIDYLAPSLTRLIFSKTNSRRNEMSASSRLFSPAGKD
jgi:hypothetical protein